MGSVANCIYYEEFILHFFFFFSFQNQNQTPQIFKARSNHEKHHWQQDPAGAQYVGNQRFDPVVRQNSDIQVKKKCLYSFQFSYLNICYDPSSEMLVIKGTFCRLFNLFPLTCRIFIMRLSERQQKGKHFRSTVVPKSLQTHHYVLKANLGIQNALAQKRIIFCYDIGSMVKSVQVN